MYKLFRPKSSGNNKCKVMKINPNVITVWTKKILNLPFFFRQAIELTDETADPFGQTC